MRVQAKRHHVVSKFYLRYFADPAGQVSTVRLPGDVRFRQSIENATVENHFYTAIDNQGEPTDVAEEAFGAIEGEAANAWRLVASGVWPLPDGARGAMAGWIALQLLRGHRVRASMDEIGTFGLNLDIIVGGRQRLRERLKAVGEAHDDASVDAEWVSVFAEPFSIKVGPNHHLLHLVEMLPRVTQSLLERWWLLTTFDRRSLATSDHPVYVVPNERFSAVGMGTGIDNADLIHVPLTHRLSLAMALRGSLPEELRGVEDDRQVAGVTATALYSNSCAVNSARRFLFHHPDESPLDGLELPQPRTQTMSQQGDPWAWMDPDDKKVLTDAGLVESEWSPHP